LFFGSWLYIYRVNLPVCSLVLGCTYTEWTFQFVLWFLAVHIQSEPSSLFFDSWLYIYRVNLLVCSLVLGCTYTEWTFQFVLCFLAVHIQSEPQMMRLHRRPYEVYIVYFLIFKISSNKENVITFCQIIQYTIKWPYSRQSNLSLELSHFNSFMSSL